MSSKITVINNFMWRFAERCGTQGVKFLLELVLARLLLPEDYGTVALITVFTQILNVFVNSGLGNALIQKKNADDMDFSTVFFFNIFWSALLYIILFICAPLIATFYGKSELTILTRVIGISILFYGVQNILQAYISRKMQFRKMFYSTLVGTVIAAVAGIIAAYKGLGVWALVVQQLLSSALACIFLWLTVDWYPQKMFSLTRLKSLYSFGWKLLISSLLNTVYNNIHQLIIGKFYKSSDLAYYNKGNQFPYLFLSNVNESINSVLFPTMAKDQNDHQKLRSELSLAIQVSTYIMTPLFIGLATVSTDLVQIILTEKWLECVPYLRIFCVTYLLYPVHTANLNVFNAMGRSDLFLKLEIVKKIVGFALFLCAIPFGPMAVAGSLVVESIVCLGINGFPSKKLLNYGMKKQLLDIFPNILLSVAMAICVFLVSLIPIMDILSLVLQILTGAVSYVVLSAVFHNSSFEFFVGILKSIIKKEQGH